MNYAPAGTAAQLRSAQLAFDDMAEPESADEDLSGWAEHLTMLADDVYEQIRRGRSAMERGDNAAALDMLLCAARQLGDSE